MKPLLLCLLILTLLLTFTYQKDTYPAQPCNKCLGDPFKKWCRPTNNEDGGICCDLNDPNSACQQGEANVCSNQKQFTSSSAKLLCPSGIKACQTHVEKVLNDKEQKVAYQVHMDQNDLCWFKVQSLKQYTKTLNVEIWNMTSAQLEIYAQRNELDYQIINQENNFQTISIPIEKDVENIYFLLQSSKDEAYASFAAQIFPHEHHDRGRKHHTLLHHIIETVIHLIIIDGILMMLVSGTLYFIGFNHKLVCMRVKKFNEAQEKKTQHEIQAINDEERCAVEVFPSPLPDLNSKDQSIDLNTSGNYTGRISSPTLKNPGFGIVKDIFLKRESF